MSSLRPPGNWHRKALVAECEDGYREALAECEGRNSGLAERDAEIRGWRSVMRRFGVGADFDSDFVLARPVSHVIRLVHSQLLNR